jgi:hypothetical protein
MTLQPSPATRANPNNQVCTYHVVSELLTVVYCFQLTSDEIVSSASMLVTVQTQAVIQAQEAEAEIQLPMNSGHCPDEGQLVNNQHLLCKMLICFSA